MSEDTNEDIPSKRVKTIMSKPVITVDYEVSVLEAAGIMARRDVGCLVVTQRGNPVGIMTERDLVRKVLAVGLGPREAELSKCISAPLITITSTDTLRDAALKMQESGIRRLPVVDQGSLVGIVTATDLARELIGVSAKDSLILKGIARYHKYGY